MRLLGIDYGEKRIGLAVSDESLTIANEFCILSPKEFWQQIKGIIQDKQISRIVLGWPLNMSGEMTAKTQEVNVFKFKIENELGLPVEVTDERLTSQMAGSIQGKQTALDSLAAQILLQNFLNKNTQKIL